MYEVWPSICTFMGVLWGHLPILGPRLTPGARHLVPFAGFRWHLGQDPADGRDRRVVLRRLSAAVCRRGRRPLLDVAPGSPSLVTVRGSAPLRTAMSLYLRSPSSLRRTSSTT